MLQKIKDLIKEYGTLIKRGMLGVNIFFMLIATQTLVNYNNIIENTEAIKKQTQKVEEEINYINNYQLKFLDSDHAKLFLSHENNILGQGETVVAFKKESKKEAETKQQNNNVTTSRTPREQWQIFFKEKLDIK